MVLYHAMSTYQILECIEHRLLVNSEEESTLVIYQFALDKIPHYEMLVNYNFFSEVFILPSQGIAYEQSKFISTIEDKIKSYIPYNLEEFKEIYVAGAHMPFTAYLMHKELDFYILEDGSGALSRPHVLAELDKNANPKKFEVLETFGLYDLYHFDYKNLKGKYCDLSAQVEGFSDKFAIDFNLVDSFNKLEECNKKKILEFFGCPQKVEITNNSALLLTQHFSNLLQLTFEEHIMIYQTVMDYFLYDYEVIIKPHPDDILFYNKLFPGAKIIKEKFPSELLPFIFNSIPKAISTVSSTSINLIRHLFDDEITFNELYEKSFMKTHRYFFALKILEMIGVNKFSTISIDDKLVDNLLQFSEINNIIKIDEKCEVILCDDYDEEEVVNSQSLITEMLESDQSNIFVFLNSLNKYKFYDFNHKELFRELLPIVINKSILRSDYNYNREEAEVIYIYTKNEKIRERINSMKINIELENSGLLISKDALRREEIRIKVLEGQLEATEKRLLEYINSSKDK